MNKPFLGQLKIKELIYRIFARIFKARCTLLGLGREPTPLGNKKYSTKNCNFFFFHRWKWSVRNGTFSSLSKSHCFSSSAATTITFSIKTLFHHPIFKPVMRTITLMKISQITFSITCAFQVRKDNSTTYHIS